MKILCFESGPLYTNAYLVFDEQSRRGVVIDTPFGCTDAIAQAAGEEEIVFEKILLTHSHWDHTGDAAALKNKFHIPVLIHADDEYRMQNPDGEIIQPPFPLAPLNADDYLIAREIISVGNIQLHVLHTPGHTEGSVCFYDIENHILFSGDTLFAGSIGRTDLPGGSWETLQASLQFLVENIPENISIFPGHGPSTTMAEELINNPFLNGSIV